MGIGNIVSDMVERGSVTAHQSHIMSKGIAAYPGRESEIIAFNILRHAKIQTVTPVSQRGIDVGNTKIHMIYTCRRNTMGQMAGTHWQTDMAFGIIKRHLLHLVIKFYWMTIRSIDTQSISLTRFDPSRNPPCGKTQLLVEF